jgi:hypothetical protein
VSADERVVRVLAEHEHWHHEGGCSCGWKLTMKDFGRWSEAHRAHVAAALGPVLAEVRAEAWDEGYDARGGDIANEGLTVSTVTPNPYRGGTP